MKIRLLFIVISAWLLPVLLFAQPDNVTLGNSFKFRDGLFLNYEQFQQNQPGFAWGEVISEMVSTKPGILKVASFRVGDAWESEPVPLEAIWGVARNGVPYIRIPQDTGETREFATFVSLRMVGKICLFSYEREQERQVVVKAYNPLTGHPFREGIVTQKDLVREEKIIYFPTGDISTLNRATLLSWIKEDEELFQALDNLGMQPSKEELYQILLMYNERNRVYTFR